MASLVVSRDGKRIRVFELEAPKVVIGRKGQPGPGRLLLEDPTVSSDHAVVERHESQFMVQDLNSRNGIILNGQKLPAGRLYPVSMGDEIRICDFTMQMSPETPSADTPAPTETVQTEGLPASVGEFQMQKIYTPRDVVGGDFFAFRVLDAERVAVGIGDATGGGAPDFETTIRCTKVARQLAEAGTPPREAASALQKALGGIPGKRTVTFLYGVLDAGDATFRYVNAGHVAPIQLNRDRPTQVRKLLGASEPLETGRTTGPAAEAEERRIFLKPGDILILMTDGVLGSSRGRDKDQEGDLKNGIREAMLQSWHLEFPEFVAAMKRKIAEAERACGPFGYEGVARACASHGGGGVKPLLPGIETELRSFLQGGSPGDDVTLIGIERGA